MSGGAIYTMWLREIKRFVRSKSRIVGTLAFPFFILVIMGTGLGAAFKFGNITYFEFLAPGMIGMVLLFSSISFGIMLIWDRQFGFLKEILVAPVSRTSIVVGKTLGGVTISMCQGLMFLGVAFILGFKIPVAPKLLMAIVVMVLISLGFVLVGIAFSSRMKDFHGFSLIMNFFIFPVFFLSGAFFPIDQAPRWLRFFAYCDPLTYGVDALRFCLLGASSFPFWVSLSALAAFSVLATAVGTLLFRTMTL
jgi:ABC-2 type transport system permease protein